MEDERPRRVNVQSLLSVVPGKPVEPPGRVHEFSPLDQAMALHTIHTLFYYRSNPFGAAATAGLPSDIHSLRVSLSRVLDGYPTATGRLARGTAGGWVVKCNDAGVRMLHAAVSATLDEWLGSADAAEEKDLTAWEDMPLDPTFWSPFRIQMNNFKCGGIAIGLSCTHMHADITSATLLIKSWAEAHSGQPLTHSPILHICPSSSPARSFHLSPVATSPPAKMGTVTMNFSGTAVERCLSQVQGEYPSVTTPFDILGALFWSRIVRMQGPVSSSKRALSVCVDLRGIGVVPYEYFGNAQHFSVVEMDGETLVNGGIGLVSDCIHRHVEGVKGDDFGSIVRWLEEHWQGKVEPPPFRVYGPRLTCINMEHMANGGGGRGLMYGVVFDSNNPQDCPARVTYRMGNVEGEGLIMVMPSAEGGRGRTVTVVLPAHQIDELCKDPAILDLEATMVGRQ